MIKFLSKIYSEDNNDDSVIFTDNLKNFYQKDIENIFKVNGNIIYKEFKFTDSSKKLNQYKRGKFNSTEVNKIIKKVIINSPFSHKDYKASDYIRVGTEKDNFEKNLDLVVKVHNGFLEFPEFDYYGFLAYIFPKYRQPDSTWHFRFIELGNNSPKPILTIPTKSSEWDEIIKACTEYLINLKLLIGDIYNIIFISSSEGNIREKIFTGVNKVVSYLPVVTSLVYRKFISPYLDKKASIDWDKTLKVNYSPGLIQKVLNHAETNYKDKLIIGNIGTASYFANFTIDLPDEIKKYVEMLSNPEMLLKYDINPNRLRSELDYHARAVREHKDCICYCDNDPLPAIAHEIGHFMENHEEILGTIQRASHRNIFSEDFVKYSGFILGLFGPIGEITGIVTGILLQFPKLLVEFKASYYGLEILKKVGATDRDLQNAKESLKIAFSTYVNHTIKHSMGGTLYGRITREATGVLYKKLKKK